MTRNSGVGSVPFPPGLGNQERYCALSFDAFVVSVFGGGDGGVQIGDGLASRSNDWRNGNGVSSGKIQAAREDSSPSGS